MVAFAAAVDHAPAIQPLTCCCRSIYCVSSTGVLFMCCFRATLVIFPMGLATARLCASPLVLWRFCGARFDASRSPAVHCCWQLCGVGGHVGLVNRGGLSCRCFCAFPCRFCFFSSCAALVAVCPTALLAALATAVPAAVPAADASPLVTAGYIGEFEYVDDHRAGKIVVNLIGRLNKCGVISPRFDVKVGQMENWVNNLLPSRQFGYIMLTTSYGIMDHEEARIKHTGGKILGFFY